MTIIVTRERAYNSNDDNQMLHGHALGSDNIKVSIIESLDINTYLPYPTDKMTTVGDDVGSFIAWPIDLFLCMPRYIIKMKVQVLFFN